MKLKNLIGQKTAITEVISPLHVKKIAATLNESSPQLGDPLPTLWHWGFFNEAVSEAHLGSDGHAISGVFLPQPTDKNRMWAGGSIDFHQDIHVGDTIQCQIEIIDIIEKKGATGDLLFIKIKYDYYNEEVLCISEIKDILYKNKEKYQIINSNPKSHKINDYYLYNDWSHSFQPSKTLLFRYSAITFNSHKIHYDESYTKEIEGYPNLVVHGPLMATFNLQNCLKNNPDKKVKYFSHRSVNPLFIDEKALIEGKLLDDNTADYWIRTNNKLIQKCTITFSN